MVKRGLQSSVSKIWPAKINPSLMRVVNIILSMNMGALKARGRVWPAEEYEADKIELADARECRSVGFHRAIFNISLVAMDCVCINDT